MGVIGQSSWRTNSVTCSVKARPIPAGISLIFVQSSLVCLQESYTVTQYIWPKALVPELVRSPQEHHRICRESTVVIEPQKEVHLKMPTFNIVVFAGDYAGPEVRSPMLT